jgi:hypothetical protein
MVAPEQVLCEYSKSFRRTASQRVNRKGRSHFAPYLFLFFCLAPKLGETFILVPYFAKQKLGSFFLNLVSGRWKQEPMTNGASGVHIYRTPLLSPSIIPPQPLSIFSSLHTNGLVERAPLLVAWWQLSQNNGNSLFDVYFWVNLS